jgi:hypothetical protein
MTIRRTIPNRRSHEVFEIEHQGIHYRVGIGRFDDGRLAEIFLDCERHGSAAETIAHDCAVLASLALQHEVSIQTIRHALMRLPNGSGAGPLGKALDTIEGLQ